MNLSVELKLGVRIELRQFPQVTLIAPTVLEQTGSQSDDVELKPRVRIDLRRFSQVTLIAPTVLEQTGGQSDEYF
ncbi:hypothetical protein Taro_008214 [Colocasia esculenta]|uniref:Uncharacterized protein n=1 Tax=Colocasia esculenta TaxID=4460 RepID=A0A843U2P1_COLES|nr:hypothetical protein [Colocasia esculenta]